MVDLTLLWTGLVRLHGSMDKKQRSAACNAFHTAESGVLLCTGVACPWPQPARVLAPDLAPPGKLTARIIHACTTCPPRTPITHPPRSL